MFFEENMRLPVSLDELKSQRKRIIERGGYDPIFDAYNNPIRYTVDGNTITLVSVGADGTPGGTGKNRDMIVDFVFSVEGDGENRKLVLEHVETVNGNR